MDPDTAYASLTDPSLPLRDRCLAGDGLEEWLLFGGYVPSALHELLSDLHPYAIDQSARIWVAGYVRALDSVESHRPA